MASDLKTIIDELLGFFEFQKSLGLEAVAVAAVEDKVEKKKVEGRRETKRVGETRAPLDKVISVEEQLSIFDLPSKKLTLEDVREELGECTRCKLHSGRTHIVFGEGNPKARIVFVGEAPGQEEDRQGKPFVGRAGQLLSKIIAAMGLDREKDTYICNVIKCRPPENRNPEPDEVASCEPFLVKQIKAIAPDIIVCLGSFAAQSILRTKESISTLRGKFHSYAGSKVIVTYHPAALLRNPDFKKPLWDDMKLVMKELG